jgi:preprotein translocase subunit SecG
MELERIEDVVLGTTMIVSSTLPTGLLLVGRGQTSVFLDSGSASVLPDRFRMLLVVVLCVCGLVLAAMGVLTIRNGRSRSTTTGLFWRR